MATVSARFYRVGPRRRTVPDVPTNLGGVSACTADGGILGLMLDRADQPEGDSDSFLVTLTASEVARVARHALRCGLVLPGVRLHEEG